MQPAEGLIAVRSKTSVPNDFFAEQAALHYLWIDWEDLWIDRKGVRHDHFHSEKSGFRAADCRTARGISVGRRRCNSCAKRANASALEPGAKDWHCWDVH